MVGLSLRSSLSKWPKRLSFSPSWMCWSALSALLTHSSSLWGSWLVPTIIVSSKFTSTHRLDSTWPPLDWLASSPFYSSEQLHKILEPPSWTKNSKLMPSNQQIRVTRLNLTTCKITSTLLNTSQLNQICNTQVGTSSHSINKFLLRSLSLNLLTNWLKLMIVKRENQNSTTSQSELHIHSRLMINPICTD